MTSKEDNRETFLPAWLREENAMRTPAYRKNVEDEIFLAQFNDIMHGYPQKALVVEGQSHPIFLFFGIPRCGKTFFSQLVTQSFDIGFIDNIAARFWRAPLLGMRLARILGVSGGESDFASDYGKTLSLSDPHDFHYFWQHWLKIDSFPYDADKKRSRIDWAKLGQTLSEMSAYWGRPALMKAIDVSYHMRAILECYPQSVLIYLQRDYIDSARSLYKGRLDNFGDPSRWYGQAPPPAKFEELQKLPWNEQIAGQLKYLVDLYESQLVAVPDDRYFRVKYYDVCHDPETVLRELEDRCARFGSRLVRKSAVEMNTIRFSSHRKDDATFDLLAAGFKKFNLPLCL